MSDDEYTTADAGAAPPHVAWEVPEVAAGVVLVAFAVLVVGGLIAGIVASTAATGPIPTSRQFIGTAITLGAEWADPLFAVALLAVLGVCW
jgi:hypothetical protein